MSIFAKHEIIIILLSLSVMLGFAKILGEVFNKIRLPSVIGEILAGIIIGPTVLGKFFPEVYTWLYPSAGKIHIAVEVMVLLGVLLLLLTAGLEVDLSSALKQGKTVALVSVCSIIVPFALGATLGWINPQLFGSSNKLAVSLFMGVALSVTALPIIAKILIDLNLFQSDFGMVILSSAMINDLFGWLIFSVVVQLLETGSINSYIIGKTILLTVSMALIILTLFRYLINSALPWIQSKTKWPGGVIAFIIIICLILSSLTESIGIHAIFGAFMAGVAIGDSPHLKEHTKDILNQFINNIFSPLFFVAIGLRIDFIHHFNPFLAVLFIGIVLTGKISGSLIAGRLSGLNNRESFALGSGMSASGAMGIILGLIGLEYKLISKETFEAIVIMAIFTSLISGPLLKFLLKPGGKLSLLDLIKPDLFALGLKAKTANGAIKELATLVGNQGQLDGKIVAKKAMEREKIMSTGVGDNLAFPHARIEGLKNPIVAVGISHGGIDFDSPDGKLSKLIFLIITPEDNQDFQIQILAELSQIFIDTHTRKNAIGASDYASFTKVIKQAYDSQKKEVPNS